jgi:hypothetical protein
MSCILACIAVELIIVIRQLQRTANSAHASADSQRLQVAVDLSKQYVAVHKHVRTLRLMYGKDDGTFELVMDSLYQAVPLQILARMDLQELSLARKLANLPHTAAELAAEQWLRR